MITAYTALIIEDDEATARAITAVARSLGYVAYVASSVAEACEVTNGIVPEILLVDLGLPDGDGISVVEDYRHRGVEEFIVISGTDDQSRVVDALRAGVSDFMTKPVRLSDIQQVMQRVVTERYDGLIGKATPARTVWVEPARLAGDSHAAQALRQSVEALADIDPVRMIIEGDAGVGKRSVAAFVHEQSEAEGETILINCAQEVDEAAMTRFFGRQGCEDGQVASVTGYMQQANAGTLVLDDISRLPAALQSMLVTWFDSGQVLAEKATQSDYISCSVIGILRESPTQAIAQGRLSDDFYYCLSRYTVRVPLLIERVDDIAAMAERAITEMDMRSGTEKVLSAAAAKRIRDYEWPGNQIEFRNTLRAAYAATDSLDEIVIDKAVTPALANSLNNQAAYLTGQSFEEVERKLVLATLEHAQGNKRATAELLGISLKTLYNRMQSYKKAEHN